MNYNTEEQIRKVMGYKLPKPRVEEIILLVLASWVGGFGIAYLHWGQGIPW